jgi:hypothetical protein
MLVAISAGCAFAVRGELILRALEHQAGKLLVQGCVDAVEVSRATRSSSASAFPMPTAWGP